MMNLKCHTKKLLFGLSILMACINALGQPSELIQSKVKALQQTKTEIIIQFSPYTTKLTEYKEFMISNPAYVFWKDNAGCYAQMFAYCYDSAGESFDATFNAIRIEHCEPIFYLIQHFDSISQQQLLPGFYKYSYEGKDSLLRIFSSHDFPTFITVYKGDTTFVKTVKDSQLDDGVIHNEDGSERARTESINYERNIGTDLYKFYAALGNAVQQLQSARRFQIMHK